MFKVQMRSNLIPFLLIVAIGIAASIYVPNFFASTKGEIPAFALFPGEIAIALILSVLIYENATPAELIKIAGYMLLIAFVDGGICNLVGQNTMLMPDLTLQLNWVQLIAYNVTGIAGVMALFATVTDTTYASKPSAVKEAPTKEAAPKIDFSPEEAAQSAEQAQEVISNLDAERIEKLEKSITPSAPEKVSLESLFAEENEAASFARAPEHVKDEPAPVKEEKLPEPEPVKEPEPAAPVLSFETPEELKPAAPEPEAAPPSGGLLNVSDGEVADLFDNLLADDSPAKHEEAPVAAQEPVAAPEPVAPPAAETAPAAEQKGGLLGDVSGDIEDIFANLAGEASQDDFTPGKMETPPAEPAAPVAELAPEPPAPEPTPAPAAQESAPAGDFGPKIDDAGKSAKAAVKEFGKLSATASNKGTDAPAGTLKTIGQMLLDTGAVERIIKSAEQQTGGSNWKVLTVDRGANLQALMDRIATFQGVESALLFGKDGLLLSNTESLSAMKYVFGPLSLAMHSTTNLGTTKLQMGELQQCVLKSGDKVNVLTDVGSAILAVFGDWNISTLDRLMAHINAAITGAPEAGEELPTEEGGVDLSPPPEEAAPSAPEPEPAHSGPINVSDNEVADIFDNLMADSSADKGAAAPAPAPEPVAAAPSGNLMNVSDKEVGDLFDNLLAEPEKKAEAEPAGETAAPAAEVAAPSADKADDRKLSRKEKKKEAKQMKEFGKLSVQAAKTNDTANEGAMKAIGKQLIDVQAVENIIKSGEKREKIGSGLTTARVISAARGEGIKTLLSKIDTYEGVIGSLIVGHDGLVIASTLTGGIDKDMMGAMCTAIYSHMDVAVKKIEGRRLQQSVFLNSDNKLTVLSTVAVGILAVFADNSGVERVDGLLKAIETTVKG
jgi:predicted regulator of Ras-like GTPase activity (Roadblock/LC7/MglB family)